MLVINTFYSSGFLAAVYSFSTLSLFICPCSLFIAKPVSMYFFAKKAVQLGLENIKDIELPQSTFFHLYKSKQRNFLFDKTGTLENHKSEYSLREGVSSFGVSTQLSDRFILGDRFLSRFVNKFLQKFTGGDSVFVKDRIYVNQTPRDKSQVVSAIKKTNHNSFNVFIGDGFNDRLAFKESDLGILFDHDTESQKLLIGNYDFSIKSFKNLESIFSLAKDVYVLDWLITCWTVCTIL